MGSFWTTVFIIMGLIALYLVLVYSGGFAQVMGSIQSVTTSETKILQGR